MKMFAFSHSKTAVSFNNVVGTDIHILCLMYIQVSNYICIHMQSNVVSFYYLWYGAT